jgi:hypothetical protein
MLPIYGEPIYLSDAERFPDMYWWLAVSPEELDQLYGATGVRTTLSMSINRKSFLRLLCKIAHCLLFGFVAEKDASVILHFRPLLTDFIRHDTGEPQLYIGAVIEYYEETNEAYSFRLLTFPRGNQEYLIMKLQLFPYLGPGLPTYYIAVAVRDLL